MDWVKCNIVDSVDVLEAIGSSVRTVAFEGKIVFGVLCIGILNGDTAFN